MKNSRPLTVAVTAATVFPKYGWTIWARRSPFSTRSPACRKRNSKPGAGAWMTYSSLSSNTIGRNPSAEVRQSVFMSPVRMRNRRMASCTSRLTCTSIQSLLPP